MTNTEQLEKLKNQIAEEIENWERHLRMKMTTYDERAIINSFIISLRVIVKVIEQ